MSVTAKVLLQSKFAENAQTTQYLTPAGTRTIIDKMTATNVTGTAATITVNLVTATTTPVTGNVNSSVQSIAANATYSFPEIVGHVLGPADTISTLANTANALVIRISGREVV